MEEKAMEEIRWIEIKKRRRRSRDLGSRIFLFLVIASVLALFLFSGFLFWERVKKRHLIDKFVFPQKQEQIVTSKDGP